MSVIHHSKEFFDLIRQIGEARSKQEEDKIILREMSVLKQHMANRKVTLRMMREFIVRVLYCEMLGHEASFGYINAIKLTSSRNLLEKKVGYLAVTLCLPKNHELILLIISNLQKDLQSTNFMEVCAALSAASKIINEETIPALLPTVQTLQKHTMAIVRKKTAMLVHTFHTIAPGSVPNFVEFAKTALCDRDPSVMGASLCLFEEIVKDEILLPEMKELTPSFVNILKQIIENRLSRDFDYHRLPAPWIQIKLLKILSALGKDDTRTSEQMYDLLREVMQRADTGLNIGHAVVFEAVRTITTIYPSSTLLEQAASAISRFITSSNHNLKYLGIQSLTSIVKINPKYASQHQMVVIDCLENRDDTLKRITLDLLYTMTNPNNVVVIVKKLIQFTKTSALGDEALRKTLLGRITELAEKFAPNLKWYIDTLNQLFFIDAAFIPEKAIADMITVISEGEGDGSEEDEALRLYSVEKFYEVLTSEDVISDKHLQVICWVLGEYGFLAKEVVPSEDIIDALCDRCERQLDFIETRCWIISALMKLCSQCVEITPENVIDLLNKYRHSKNVALQQRCNEFLAMLNYPRSTMEDMLPKDGGCEEIEVDARLSFLNGYVQQARNMGARDYLTNTVDLASNMPKFEKTLLILEHKKTPEELTVTPLADRQSTNTRSTSISVTSQAVDVSVPGQSHYPSSASSESGLLNPSLLVNKKMTWVDSDDEDEMQEQQEHSAQTQHLEPHASFIDSSNQGSPVSISSSTTNHETVQKDERKISKESRKLMDGIFGGNSASRSGTSVKKSRRKKRDITEENMIANDHQLDNNVIASDHQLGNNLAKDLDDLLDMSDVTEIATAHSQSISPIAQEHRHSSSPILDEDPFGDIIPIQSNNGSISATNVMTIDNLLQPSSSANDDMLPGVSTADKNFMRPGVLLAQLMTNTIELTTKNKQPILLTQDQNINVKSHKFYDVNGDLLIVLLLGTEGGFSLTNLHCQFQTPEKFSIVEMQSDHPDATTRNNTVTIPRCDPGTPITVAVRLRLSGLGFGNQFIGTVRYSDPQQNVKFCSISTQITVADVMRAPKDTITVAEFGGQWPQNTHEKRVQIMGRFALSDFKSQASADMNIRIVQTKGNEVIGYSTIMQLMVLTHAKVTDDAIVFTVRSKDMSLSEAVCRFATDVWTAVAQQQQQ